MKVRSTRFAAYRTSTQDHNHRHQKGGPRMTADPNATDRGTAGTDPAAAHTDQLPDASADPGSYGEQGDRAETAAFVDEGAYSGGEFAGAAVEREVHRPDLG